MGIMNAPMMLQHHPVMTLTLGAWADPAEVFRA